MEGVGRLGCQQMEGICFAELNSSAWEVWKNLTGMGIRYPSCLFPFLLDFSHSPWVLGKRCLVSIPLWP